MKRVHLNAMIDGGALFGFMCLASTGLILRYQLPPGSGGLKGYGAGRGAMSRQIDLLWGLTRHEWGDVHFWIAFALLAVLSVHLVLHWKWIVGVIQGKSSGASGWRLAIGAFAFCLAALFVALPLLSRSDSATRHELQQLRSDQPGLGFEAGSNSHEE